jgi:hypothetical protein
MRLDSDFHFQVRRQTPRGLPRQLITRYGKLNLGDLSALVNRKLDDLVIFPGNRQYFSLFNIECMNGNSYGYRDISIDIPAAYLRFHFVANRNLDDFPDPIDIKSRLVRYKTLKSDLILPNGEKPVRVYSVGLTIKDLGHNYYYFIQNLGESDLQSLKDRLRENLQDAIRDATLCGKDMDFDPDALMQSFMRRVFSQTSIGSRAYVIEEPANGAD